MGGSSKPKRNPQNEALSRISQQLFADQRPIRLALNERAEDFVGGNLDVTGTPGFAAIKDMIESQFGRARESTIANTATGGGLSSALAGVERGRASSLVQGVAGLAEQESGRALTLATGLVPSAIGGASSAAFTQGQAIEAAAGRSGAKAGSSGQAAGRVAAAFIGK